MNNDVLIRTIKMDCPLCDKNHDIEERKRISKVTIKGDIVEYEETYFICINSDEDENEFAPAKIYDNNMLNARNAYRVKNGLLTSDEIVNIRENYELTQNELSNLLGWGEVTISRYESKSIQDEAYDNVLRIIRENPMAAYNFLIKNKSRFGSLKFNSLKEKIIQKLDEYGKKFLKRQSLESDYVNYQEESDFNGNTILNIDKLESIITYLAKRIPQLYKVKLMKLLWYVDVISFKITGHSMIGLVYLHEPMGALPLAHYKIIDLEKVCVEEEYDDECTKYHILPNNNLDLSNINCDELDILDCVIKKFKDFNSQQIVNYMHKEKAYLETNDKQKIPFSLAKHLRKF